MAKKEIIKELDQIKELTKIDKLKYTKVFSDRFGIINGLLRRYDLEPYKYSIFQSLSARTQVLFSLSREVSSGGLGISNNTRSAFYACMGESLERYCMSHYDDSKLLNKKYSELPPKFRVNNFSLYSKEQYSKNKNFTNPLTQQIYWEKVDSYLHPGQFKYWPASLIYLPFEKGKNSAETTSTGVSAHPNKNKAVISGLLELIERDALMINFLLRLNPPEISIHSIQDINKSLINKLSKNGRRVKIYKLHSDINIPIYAGLIWTKKKNIYHYGIGACAALDSQVAIEKTLKECLFTYLYSKDMLHLKQNQKNKIKALCEHFLYYQGSSFEQLPFKSSEQDYAIEKVSLKQLLKNLKQLNLEIFYKELTTPDISSTEVRVFRVIVPGLIDINKSHQLPRLGAERLRTIPRKLGIAKKMKISSMPHPFP